jgi:hypothetical protein
LLLIAGQRCEKLMDSLHNIPVTDVQMDECWNFIYCKEKNKGPEQADNDEIGDCYNWVAMDRPTKLVLAFVCGRRTGENAMELMRKVRRASSCRWRRERGPVWRAGRDHLRGYAMDLDGMARALDCGLVALRQLSLPYGNRAFLRRDRRCPYDFRSARLSQAKSSFFFTGQRRKVCGLAASK